MTAWWYSYCTKHTHHETYNKITSLTKMAYAFGLFGIQEVQIVVTVLCAKHWRTSDSIVIATKLQRNRMNEIDS